MTNISTKNFKNKQTLFMLSGVVFLVSFFLLVPFHVSEAGLGTKLFQGLMTGINYALYVIFVFVSLLVVLAAALMDWVINPKNLELVVGNTQLYNFWKIIRDFLNLAFILVLLFSAFATIFQIERFNAKKILLTLVIMALLVNFSFPIARIIIDASNVMMYFFLNAAFPWLDNNGTTGISGLIAKMGHIKDLVFDPEKKDMGEWVTTIHIIAAIVFMFSFGITMLVIAFILLIRIIVLAILIIFSPLGFVATIFPSTKNYASDWWRSLFKQSFIGPILAFGLALALKVMAAMDVSTSGTGSGTITAAIKSHAGSYVAGENTSAAVGDDFSKIIVTGMTVAIPIVFLWAVIIGSQKMGAIGASLAVAKAKGIGKWAGTKYTGYGALKRGYTTFKKRREEAAASGSAVRAGRWFGSKIDQIRSSVKVGKLGKRGALDAGVRYQRDMSQRVEDDGKRHDTKNMTNQDLTRLASTGNRFERAAAAIELAARGLADSSHLNQTRTDFTEDSQVYRQLANQVKTYDPVAAFTDSKGVLNEPNLRNFINSNQFDLKKIGLGSIQNQRFMELLFETSSVKTKDIEDIAGKSAAHKNTINTSLNNMVTSGKYNTATDSVHQNINMAHFARSGEITNTAFANEIFSNMDKDSAKRMTLTTITNYQTEIENNIKQGRISDIAHNMEDSNAARALVNNLRTQGPHQNYVKNHPTLSNF